MIQRLDETPLGQDTARLERSLLAQLRAVFHPELASAADLLGALRSLQAPVRVGLDAPPTPRGSARLRAPVRGGAR
ncbi:MAG: hypothetical protein V4850_34820 [Myxococcota bacterium]